ncbi:MAG TPA: S8 family serine peptidase [Woeseiaceae bacterium]
MKTLLTVYTTALAAALLATFAALPASAQLLPPSPIDDIARPLDGPLPDDTLDDVNSGLESLEEPLGKAPLGKEPLDQGPVDETLGEAPLGDALSGVAAEDLGEVVENTAAAVPATAQPVIDTALGPVRPFVESVDPFGHAIEKDVLMVLIEPAAVAALERSGAPIAETQPLRSLGLVLVRITGPAAPSLARAAGDLRAQFPDAAVDYNFLYRPAEAPAPDVAAPGDDATGAGEPGPSGARLRIGLIDSAVATQHAALSGVHVVTRDFAPHEGERPLGHGTAVASILAATAGEDADILAASVFFQKRGYAPGATTESLVAALDWLAGSGVEAINMSLAGPSDTLLERALGRIPADGPVVVAAVGNNGPAAEPLYPAAYDSVVGVTAIDSNNRIFAYANRGKQVEFAAPGVDVKVADSLGGYFRQSGTSIASPYVAAVIAAGLHETGLSREAVLESLRTSAVDLGDEGFDPVFGYGLVQRLPAQNAAASLTE